MITVQTRLVGLLGYPLGHSLSPAMQNAAFAATGQDFVYLPMPVAPGNLPEAVAGLKALGFCGANVTIPHKESVLPLVDYLSPEARLVGAVNTMVIRGGKLEGHNTDAPGFLRSLREEGNFDPAGIEVLVLGAGGAARAVGFALAGAGAREIHVANRTHERAGDLVAALLAGGCRARAWSLDDPRLAEIGRRASLIVQTTSVGMHPHPEALPPLDWGFLRPGQLVCDLVYNPRETALLRLAAGRGCRVLSGLGMLVYQGALAFELWTGCRAPIKAMYAAVTGA